MLKNIALYNFRDTTKIIDYFVNQKIEFKELNKLEDTDKFDLVITHNCIDMLKNEMINVHPSLLPAYPSKDAIIKAFSDGVKVSGITIHTKEKIIAQYPIIIGLETHIDDFINEIQEIENKLLPIVIDTIINNRVFDFKDIFSNGCNRGGCSNCKGCN